MSTKLNPHVTIFVLNWNQKDLTIQTLESLQKVKYPNFSIVVIDNGSTDGSVSEIKQKKPEIPILSLSKNYGYAGGNNRGFYSLSANSTDFVTFLNNDTIVAPEFLTELIKSSFVYGRNNIYGPKIFYDSEPELIWYAGGIVNLKRGRLFHRGIRKFDSPEFFKTTKTDFITGCCLMCSWETFKKLDGFDETFNMYSEDVDFCLRAKKSNIDCYFIPSAHIWHKISASMGGELTIKKNIRKFRSLLKLIRRHTSPFDLFFAIFYFCIKFPYQIVSLMKFKLLNSKNENVTNELF